MCVLVSALMAVDVAAGEDCDHQFQVVEVEGTCVDPGMEYEECVHCGLQINYANTPALGHDFGQWMVQTPAACTKEGTECRVCTRCGVSEERESEAMGHDYETKIVAPQCTTKGYTLTTCSNCGDSSKSDYTEATGHDYELTVVEPGCTAAGYTQNTCKNCGKISQKKGKAALGHNYEPDESGTKVCGRCGDMETVIAPAVTEPTETESEPVPTQATEPIQTTESTQAPEPIQTQEPTQPPKNAQAPKETAGSTAAPTEPAAEEPRRTFCLRTRSDYPGWFRLAETGVIHRVDGLDPDIGPICGQGRVHFLWGFGTARRSWLQWARMEE